MTKMHLTVGPFLVSILFGIAFTCSGATSGSADKSGLEALLVKPFVRAEFVKQRKLAILTKPFVTQGYILFDRDKGMVWKTTAPVNDTLLITETSIRQFDGEKQTVVSDRNPVMTSISDMFLTIMSLDKDKILSVYELQSSGSDKQMYRLLPRDKRMQSIISYIQLVGADRIQSIEIMEKSGDSTRIEITNERYERAQLTADDRALLEKL